jgi:hypothetical protein
MRGAALVAGLVLGFQEIFQRPREPVPMVVDFSGDPPALEPITLFFHPQIPEATLVLLQT